MTDRPGIDWSFGHSLRIDAGSRLLDTAWQNEARLMSSPGREPIPACGVLFLTAPLRAPPPPAAPVLPVRDGAGCRFRPEAHRPPTPAGTLACRFLISHPVTLFYPPAASAP